MQQDINQNLHKFIKAQHSLNAADADTRAKAGNQSTCKKNSSDGLIHKHSESLHNPDLSNYSLSFPVTLAFLHIFQPLAPRLICIFHHPS